MDRRAIARTPQLKKVLKEALAEFDCLLLTQMG